MSENNYSTWSGHDIFTIKIVGTRDWVLEQILTLVEDFEEPKFGHLNEYWDEEDDRGFVLEPAY